MSAKLFIIKLSMVALQFINKITINILVVVKPILKMEKVVLKNHEMPLNIRCCIVVSSLRHYNMYRRVVTYIQNKLSLDSSKMDRNTRMKQNTIVILYIVKIDPSGWNLYLLLRFSFKSYFIIFPASSFSL